MTTWQENPISKQDLMILQQDAVRRVRKMQAQARAHLQQTQSSFSGNNENYEEAPPENIQNIHNQNNQTHEQNNQNKSNQYPNFQNNNWANNNGHMNPNFNGPPFPNNPGNFPIGGKNPLQALTGFFTKGDDKKGGSGGISDIIGNLIPKRDGNSPISKVLDALDLDTEKIILIILIILLLNDGADYTLILALGYILL